MYRNRESSIGSIGSVGSTGPSKRVALEIQIDATTKEIEKLRLENSVFQKFFEKKTIELGVDEDDKKKKKKKMAVSLLTPEQKNDISNVIFEDLQAEIESNRKNSEKMIDTLRAVLEETEIRIGELKRDAYEFKRDVVVGAENSRTGKIIAERVTRYFEDKIKQIQAVVEKLRLKNSTLKSQINKVESQLAQKEEVGDVLHYIDFHQLQIENKQFVSKIEERNEELLTVKISTGKTIQALNDYKHRLSERTEESDYLKNELTSKKTQLSRLIKENSRVGSDTKNEKRMRNRLRQQIEEAVHMPDVGDYIMQKRQLYDLQYALKNWKKKVEIMEMAARRAKSLSSQQEKFLS